MTETVLVFGASGNVGIAAVIGALRSKRNVIAIVRNQSTAEKIFKYVGTRDGITTVEADINSEESIRGVVDQVRAGKLPSFQHVWASPGYLYSDASILDTGLAGFRESMAGNVDTYLSQCPLAMTREIHTNFLPVAYLATIPYLLEQGFVGSSWTMCTGSQGDLGFRAAPAVTQGALFSFAISAARELEDTAIRFNEVLLGYRVQQEVEPGVTSFYGMPITTSTDFGPLYEQLVDRKDIKGSRVKVYSPQDVIHLKFEKRF